VKDRDTGRARGFGFVEMESAALANQAISALNGTDIEGRQVAVSLAKPQTSNGGRSSSRGW